MQYITYEELWKVNFPVFSLPSDDYRMEDGLVYLDDRLIDDRNQIGKTLGERRLQSPHKMKRIANCCRDALEIITSKNNSFIDNLGYFFTYKKTKFVDVRYHKILEVTQRDVFTTMRLYEVPHPVKVPRPPPEGKSWVGMLYLEEFPWLPYEYSDYYCATVRKKI